MTAPFPRYSAAAGAELLPAGVDEALSRELVALLEREPEIVAQQVRAWMSEETA